MRTLLLSMLLMLLACSSEPIATTAQPIGSCAACASWVTWGERENLCPTPSQGLADALLSCLRRPDGDPSGGCATSCSAYLASYDACAASGDPNCVPGGVTACGSPLSTCEVCLEGACGAYAGPCSADTTECVSCAAWAGGGFSGNLLCPDSIQPVIDIAACACAGPCAQKCAGACSHPCAWVLDPAAETNACGKCLANAAPKGCASTEAACLAN